MVSVLDVLDIFEKVYSVYSAIKDNYDAISFSARQKGLIENYLRGARIQLEFIRTVLKKYKDVKKDDEKADLVEALKGQVENVLSEMEQVKAAVASVKSASKALWLYKGSSLKSELIESANGLHIATSRCFEAGVAFNLTMELSVETPSRTPVDSKEGKEAKEEPAAAVEPVFEGDILLFLKLASVREETRRLNEKLAALQVAAGIYAEAVEASQKLLVGGSVFFKLLHEKLESGLDAKKDAEAVKNILEDKEKKSFWKALETGIANEAAINFILSLNLSKSSFKDSRSYDKASEELSDSIGWAENIKAAEKKVRETYDKLSLEIVNVKWSAYVIRQWGSGDADDSLGEERCARIEDWLVKLKDAKDRTNELKQLPVFAKVGDNIMNEVEEVTTKRGTGAILASVKENGAEVLKQISYLTEDVNDTKKLAKAIQGVVSGKGLAKGK